MLLFEVPVDVSGAISDSGLISVVDSSFLKPLLDIVQPFLLRLSLIVGGIFGLYLIMILMRVYYERKKVKLLENIRYDLDHLNMHYGLRHSREKRGIFKKIANFFSGKPKETNKESEKVKKASK